MDFVESHGEDILQTKCCLARVLPKSRMGDFYRFFFFYGGGGGKLVSLGRTTTMSLRGKKSSGSIR